MKIKLLTGKRFGKLVGLARKAGNFYDCQCDCGNTTTCHANNLRNGNSRSCGCLRSISKLGKLNPVWKGDKVGYSALHLWVRQRLTKPTHCQICNELKQKLDLANVSGKYLRDLTDWEYLCRTCHMTKDGRLAKAIECQKSRKIYIPPCLWCGKIYNRKSGQRTAKFCSRDCFFSAGGRGWKRLITKKKEAR